MNDPKRGIGRKVSVVFVNYNTTDYIIKAIGTLLEELPDAEVIVIDNASREPVERIPQTFPNIKFYRNKRNLGFAKAVNDGIRRTKGEYVLLANPDTVTTRGSLLKLIELMEGDEKIGVVGPQLYYPNGSIQHSCRRFPKLMHLLSGRRSIITKIFPQNPLSRSFLYQDLTSKGEPTPVDAIIGTYMLIRRKALEEVGYLDDKNFFLFAEDLDLCKRMWNRGWKVYFEPSSRIIHYHGMARKRLKFKSEYHKRRAIYRFLLKHNNFNIFQRTLLGLGLGLQTGLLAFLEILKIMKKEPFWAQ
jgi:hypothetical protein